MTTSPIRWADIARVKKLAKSAKLEHPHLTHSQRLDHCARQTYGVRHFHELQQRYDASVRAELEDEGNGVKKCRVCDFTFSANVKSDVTYHHEMHASFEEAETVFGFRPEGYRRREEIKTRASRLLRSTDLQTQVEGALAILVAHFYRSLANAIQGGYWHKHPSFAGYLSAAVPAAQFLPDGVRQHLIDRFGALEEPLPQGRSEWPSNRTANVRPSGKSGGDALVESVMERVRQHVDVASVLVQQWYEAADEHYELGAPVTLELSETELAEAENGIAWIERLNGFYSVVGS